MPQSDDPKLRVAILGCTGSIGRQALDVCAQHSDLLEVVALSAHGKTKELVDAARTYHVACVAVTDSSHATDPILAELPKGTELLFGADALARIVVRDDVDCVLNAVVGAAGLTASYETLRSGKRLALANKESLVVGGDVLMPLARPGQMLPVDSEHSAIFQCLVGEERNPIHAIWLTCSGGPFYGRTHDELAGITAADALRHPTWSMGPKITIDSATLMNKGLERIEAMHLFGVPMEQITVLIQRESKIHSMVEYEDGAVIAQLGTPDMRLPIQYALYYPNRRSLSGKRLNFYELGSLTFEEPDMETFQGLSLAMKAMKAGGNMPTVFNAANERAVAMFLEKKIGFWNIPEIIEASMEHVDFRENPSLEKILSTEQEVYEYIESRWKP